MSKQKEFETVATEVTNKNEATLTHEEIKAMVEKVIGKAGSSKEENSNTATNVEDNLKSLEPEKVKELGETPVVSE
ncbi:MAG TPA: hypothetical protein LFW21_07750 [Rickettsia endosymbiont of Pyrocoelia pectoralis]|nr:hypothetical protein [Rickettsia endosymbiont of Pyrocoelia pectoralis]